MTGSANTPSDRHIVVVPEYLPAKHLEMMYPSVDVIYDPDLYGDRESLFDALASASAIVIRNRTIIDETLLGAAPHLSVVGRLGVGLDNVDVEALAKLGVRLFPAHGANAVSVAEYVIGAMLFLTRGVFDMTSSMKAGEWPRQGHAFGHELHGSTLGLVGLGAIAREVAGRAGALGMEVLAYDPYVPSDDEGWSLATSVALADLLARADVVSVHVPLTEQTRNLMDAEALSRMRPGSILINTSRGGTVDEAALVAALREGSIGGAALDVFVSEPLDPPAARHFAGLDNVLLTPHIAGNTVESVDRVAFMTVRAVLQALGLDPPD